MRYSLITIFFILFALSSHSQISSTLWAQSAGGSNSDAPVDIAIDSQGNVFTVGKFTGPTDFNPSGGGNIVNGVGDWDIFLLKHDANGSFQWVVPIGSSGSDRGTSVDIDSQGNIYITGVFGGLTMDADPGPGSTLLVGDGTFGDGFIAKYDTNGNLVWAHALSSSNVDACMKVYIDDNDDIYGMGYVHYTTVDLDPGAGTYTITSQDQADVYLFKWDSNAGFIWGKQITSDDDCTAYGLDTDSNNNLYVNGHFQGTVDLDPGAGTFNVTTATYPEEGFIVKLDAAGDFVWGKTFAGSDWVSTDYVKVDLNDDIYISGRFKDSIDVDPGPGTVYFTSLYPPNDDAYMIKLSSNGDYLWGYPMKGQYWEYIRQIEIDPGNNVYTVGSFRDTMDFDPGPGTNIINNAGGYDIFIEKMDPAGNVIWVETINTVDNERAYAFALDPNDYTLAVTGSFYNTVDFSFTGPAYPLTSAGSNDIFVAKYQNNIAGVEQNNIGNQSFKVYPNPTAGNIRVTFESLQNLQINIRDVFGRIVQQTTISNSNFADLKLKGIPGMYFLEIIHATGEREMIPVSKI